jgi:hypothetical protein
MVRGVLAIKIEFRCKYYVTHAPARFWFWLAIPFSVSTDITLFRNQSPPIFVWAGPYIQEFRVV